jgi:hypothetical protein
MKRWTLIRIVEKNKLVESVVADEAAAS